jgi:hypothetical protein
MHISYYLCTKAMTNVFFKYMSILSHRLKGKWSSSAKTRLLLHSNGIIYPSPSLHITLQIGIIFHSYFIYQWGRGLSTSPFLAINAKGGEILSPKQTDRTTNFKNFRNNDLFSFHKSLFFQLVSCDKQFLQWSNGSFTQWSTAKAED